MAPYQPSAPTHDDDDFDDWTEDDDEVLVCYHIFGRVLCCSFFTLLCVHLDVGYVLHLHQMKHEGKGRFLHVE